MRLGRAAGRGGAGRDGGLRRGLEADGARLKHGAEDAESRAAEERLQGERLLLEASSAADRERHELRAAAEAAERKLCAAEARGAEALDVAAAAAKGEAAELARSRRRLEAALQQAEQEGERLRAELDASARALDSFFYKLIVYTYKRYNVMKHTTVNGARAAGRGGSHTLLH